MRAVGEDVVAYERWLRAHCAVVADGLSAKHDRMRKSPFDFFRATYFRWARTIEVIAADLQDAPRVVCVGDAHVENFGTWRDADGRLVWGVNDFDEAARMPYAYDLVRLATSALLAPHIALRPAQVARALLAGYAEGLRAPQPTLVHQHTPWLRPFADADDDAADAFWKALERCQPARPPAAVRRALLRRLPDGVERVRFAERQAGGGSLGRPRFLALARWRGGLVVREAKALVPSAWLWAHGKRGKRSRFDELARGRYRAPDAALHADGAWVVRRLAPDSHKLDLADVAASGLTAPFLQRMGADLAAVHAASGRSRELRKDLSRRDPQWLRVAAKRARKAALADYEQYTST